MLHLQFNVHGKDRYLLDILVQYIGISQLPLTFTITNVLHLMVTLLQQEYRLNPSKLYIYSQLPDLDKMLAINYPIYLLQLPDSCDILNFKIVKQ